MALRIESMGRSSGARHSFAPAASLFWGWRNSRSGGPLGRMAAEGLAAARGCAAGFVGKQGGSCTVGARALLVLAKLAGARVVCAPASRLKAWAMPPFTCQHRRDATAASHNKSVQTDRVTAGFARLRASADLQRYPLCM